MKTPHIFLASLFTIVLFGCQTDGNWSMSGAGMALGGDTYTDHGENPFLDVASNPISTFSIDADGASYANTRRFIDQDYQIPPIGAIRTEELINYFDLDYPYSDPTHPIALNGEVSQCPWDAATKLVRIGMKGKPIAENDLPNSNFVFLIDVSGSMNQPDKLELLKTGFKNFVNHLSDEDKVAIVTYAGASKVVLESTSGSEKEAIKCAIDALGAGGGTAGAEGIITGYEIAQANFINNGNNRIIIGTDGDFNVGPASQEELVSLIEAKRDQGIFLTVLGVGRGNLNDASLEQIANHGNGAYEYIDKISQLQKVFIYERNKFFTVAKDVKVQVEFNPNNVKAYRLIGYENRLLSTEDFDDDSEDAGELGADQNITALYEIVPRNNPSTKDTHAFTIDFRYKEPTADTSTEMQLEIYDEGNSFEQSSDFMKFSASVASFSMLLTNSPYKGESNYERVLEWYDATDLADNHGFKGEFRSLVSAASNFE